MRVRGVLVVLSTAEVACLDEALPGEPTGVDQFVAIRTNPPPNSVAQWCLYFSPFFG